MKTMVAGNILNKTFNYGVAYWIEQNHPEYVGSFVRMIDDTLYDVRGVKAAIKAGVINEPKDFDTAKAFGLI